MGRSIYFSDKEIKALVEASSEWCEMMENGNKKSCQLAEERLNNGLGAALKKLYKGCNGERIYKDY